MPEKVWTLIFMYRLKKRRVSKNKILLWCLGHGLSILMGLLYLKLAHVSGKGSNELAGC